MTRTVFQIGKGAIGAMATPGAVVRFIHELPLDKLWSITVELYKSNRSGAQNSLMWKWNTEIGEYLGYSKEEFHEIAKEKFAVPIFYRDDPEFASMVAAVHQVRKAGMGDEADNIKRQIIALTSTTKFNVSQMAEYLTSIERFAIEQGAPITHPEDLMQEAMGRKKP